MPHSLGSPSASDATERRILDTASSIPQPRDWAIVGPTCKLLLHRLREHRSVNVRVGGSLGREFAVKVGCVQCINLRVLASDVVFYVRELIHTTFGLNTGSYFLCRSFLQSMALKN